MIIFILLWVLLGILAAGGLVRDAQAFIPSMAEESYRQDLGVGLGLGLLFGPITFIVSIFLTGFWEHGWGLNRYDAHK